MANQKFDIAAARARCRKFRKRILDISQSVGALHIAPAFSCLELVDTAYFGLMKRTGNPEADDTFILSKGHGSLAQFVVLEELGVISPEQLNHYCKPGWPLATHPDYGTPGIEASTGSLGHGLGLAVGMAYADKMDDKDREIYVVLSDGELMEGSVWEALMAAPSFGITPGYERSDGVSAVVYNGPLNHVKELALSGGSWSLGDLSTITNSPAAIGFLTIGLILIGGWAAFRYGNLLLDPSYPVLVLGCLTAIITFYTYHSAEAQRSQIRH